MCASFSTASLSTSAGENPLGQFDAQADVGSPKNTGSAQYRQAEQEYALSGSGINIWGASDQFHFLCKKLSGDFILRARIEFVGNGGDPHRKIGWMIRPSLDADAPYVDAARHGNGQTSLQFRRAKGAETEEIVLSVTNADVLQLERKGSSYTVSAARSGEPFVSASLSNVDLGNEAHAGLFVCAHNGDVTEKAVFRDVRIIRPVKEGFVPYQDYIGCTLEILDIHTGDLRMIHSSKQPFEAPNWTPDGRAVIYNSSGRSEGWGRLYRFDLDRREAVLINTDFAIRNNNDHVLSFDGKMLGISHHSTNHAGQSAVFTLPATGGTPRLVTKNTPSYLHGWSPDGKFLVYTGGRNGKYDIYKIPAAGGEEVRLTDAKGLSDGPEYSPDGKFIYFNSTRSGTMQIWRMKPDGTSQEQVTNDEYNNWFPHVSPDGKWIVYLSFPKEVAPEDHPYYKHVYLRLMPFAGGPSRVIAYVYGGQGTINVRSWSPDSRKIAFVSNTGSLE
ncbi:MAG TPA: biopolymer transporter TolR [Verrucomicrobiae bacterium]|nr:biopolymer transporter TolR [Verrucomicrobiae bacterium]